jgi:hypothetical protein
MESYLKREEFEITVTSNILEFFNKLQKREFMAKIDTFFGHNPQISRLTSEIGLVSKLNNESVKILIQSILEFSYNNYKVDMQRNVKKISALRCEL